MFAKKSINHGMVFSGNLNNPAYTHHFCDLFKQVKILNIFRNILYVSQFFVLIIQDMLGHCIFWVLYLLGDQL